MKIIFLDIDGVLTNMYTKFEFADADCMRLLNQIVFESGAEVVLTSSRRFTKNISRQLTDWGADFYIFGVTPFLSKEVTESGFTIPYSKADEIQEWMKGKELEGYAVIDDQIIGLESIIDHCVITNGNFGLREIDTPHILRILNSNGN